MSDDTTEPRTTTPVDEESLGFLVARLSDQTSRLVRSEVDLAKAEMSEKGKRAGIGIGAFSAAGLLAFFALAVLLAAAVLGLAEAFPGWLAALVVGAVVLVLAAIAAVIGKNNVSKATPAKPEQALEGVAEDIAVVKEGLT